MTNICVAYTLPNHAEAQIHGIEQFITALMEKAEKLVYEIEAQAAYGTETGCPRFGGTDGQPPMGGDLSKTDIVSDFPEPKNEAGKVALPWSYWQDDLTEVSSLINASLNLSEIGDYGGAFIVLSQAAKKANFLNTYMDSVNAGKTRNDVIARHNLEAVA